MSTRALTRTLAWMLFAFIPWTLQAQDYNSIDADGNITTRSSRQNAKEGNDKSDFPRGMRVWTVDSRFGDITPAEPDTTSFMYMNSIFTTGLHGEYNTTGNLGAPRQNRIFTDRTDGNDFIFLHPYDYFLTQPEQLHFTNTYSPITNLSLNSCGNRTNGEDHFKALFAVNAGRRIGVGMKFDYLYGRGYYSDNSSSLNNYTLWGSYLGDRYQAHLQLGTNHMKQAENGGITDDNYITHPERFKDRYSSLEIPTMLTRNWNRNDHQQVFFSHRYSFGFNRQVPMTEEEIKARKFAIASAEENAAKKAKEDARAKALENDEDFDEEEYDRQAAFLKENEPKVPVDTTWMKDEYVPVTSFIHTLDFKNYKHVYQAYSTPSDYYANTFATQSRFGGDSIYDDTKHLYLKNTFAIALLEGFNKYIKTGAKVFAAHEYKRFTLPDSLTQHSSYNENTVYVGGQISKTEGKLLHYNVTGEFGVVGSSFGDLTINADADLNFRLFGDTVQLAASAFFHNLDPTFYYTHYHSKHFWWDNEDFKKQTHTRIQGQFSLQRTGTRLRVALDNIKDYIYFGTSYTETDNYTRTLNTVTPRQSGNLISVVTATLSQAFKYKIIHLDTDLTFQKSSHDNILPLPMFNAYANLYLRFKIAHVLDCDLGADGRYFTKYHAPDFVPGIAQYAVQENEESRVDIGNYPIVNVYANFFLKHARFFVMMSHVNCSSDGGNYFLTPHYPINQRIFRFGVSWNFFN